MSEQAVVVWDLETMLDLEAAARVYDLILRPRESCVTCPNLVIGRRIAVGLELVIVLIIFGWMIVIPPLMIIFLL